MQRKLKSVFRSSSRKHDEDSEPGSPQSSHTPQSSQSYANSRGASLEERRDRRSLDSYTPAGASHQQQQSRSRPLSAAYDDRVRNVSGPAASSTAGGHAYPRSSEPANESIATNYQAYLPALSPVYDSNDQPPMKLEDDRQHMGRESNGHHEGGVADRNIGQHRKSLDVSKRKPLPAPPVVDRDRTTNGGLVHRTRPHTETAPHERSQWKTTDLPERSARNESNLGSSTRRPQGPESDDGALRSPPGNLRQVESTHNGHNGNVVPLDRNHDIKQQIDQLLEGVVDLRNTVDTDQDVTFAPAVTHEVIKPHQHEIIQHKIFREIHNYEHYRYMQPVYHLEVLPPRHWIPNPNGEGLIEINADELPSRTGDNRRWKIVREDVQLPSEMRPKWRTEPEVIQHPTLISEDGFERKETTILYPPTLQDMSEYDGLVQPVHFDHKTGERWLGEITTMHSLREQLGQVVDPAQADPLTMNELAEHLPHVPEVSQVPALSPTNLQSPTSLQSPMTPRSARHSTSRGVQGMKTDALDDIYPREHPHEMLSDLPSRQRALDTDAYREGLVNSKGQHVQEGFDEGYSLGAILGLRVGQILGVLHGFVASWKGRDNQLFKETKATYDIAQRELAIEELLGQQWVNAEGIWQWDVTGEDEDPTFTEVAEQHPVVKKWANTVEEMADRWGVDLQAVERMQGSADESQAVKRTPFSNGSTIRAVGQAL